MVNLDVAAVYGQLQNSAELGVRSVSSGKWEVCFRAHMTITLPNGKRKTWRSAGIDSLEHAGAIAFRCAIWAAGLSAVDRLPTAALRSAPLPPCTVPAHRRRRRLPNFFCRGHEICVANDWASPWGLGYPEECIEYSNNNFAGIHDFDTVSAGGSGAAPASVLLGALICKVVLPSRICLHAQHTARPARLLFPPSPHHRRRPCPPPSLVAAEGRLQDVHAPQGRAGRARCAVCLLP